MSHDATPGRLRWRSGVSFALGLMALAALPGCEVLGGGETLQLDSAEITLPSGAEIHDVAVAGAGAVDSIAPAAVRASPGDVVRFTVGDNRTHALAFAADSLSSAVRQFLDRTTQLRGPPLVNEGTAWVVSLEEAPPGRYPFYCRSHDARGVVVVQPSS